MIEPPPLLIISGIAYFAISIIEATLTCIALSHASISTSTALPRGPAMPTLLTRMSSLPQASAVRATIAWHDTGTLTSPSTICETPPSASISRLVSSTHCATVSTSVTRAPCRARTTAVARPLPIPSAREPAPVTMATLPSRRSSLRIAVAISLEHAVGVGGFFGDILHDIPVLDDLAVLKLENLDDRAATAPFLAHAVDVQDHVIPVRKYTFDL